MAQAVGDGERCGADLARGGLARRGAEAGVGRVDNGGQSHPLEANGASSLDFTSGVLNTPGHGVDVDGREQGGDVDQRAVGGVGVRVGVVVAGLVAEAEVGHRVLTTKGVHLELVLQQDVVTVAAVTIRRGKEAGAALCGAVGVNLARAGVAHVQAAEDGRAQSAGSGRPVEPHVHFNLVGAAEVRVFQEDVCLVVRQAGLVRAESDAAGRSVARIGVGRLGDAIGRVVVAEGGVAAVDAEVAGQ